MAGAQEVGQVAADEAGDAVTRTLTGSRDRRSRHGLGPRKLPLEPTLASSMEKVRLQVNTPGPICTRATSATRPQHWTA